MFLFGDVLLELIVKWNQVLEAVSRPGDLRESQNQASQRQLLQPSLLPQVFVLNLLFPDGKYLLRWNEMIFVRLLWQFH